MIVCVVLFVFEWPRLTEQEAENISNKETFKHRKLHGVKALKTCLILLGLSYYRGSCGWAKSCINLKGKIIKP